MKKTTLIIIVALSLITLVSAAITIGTVFTQNQLDSQDVMNTDLEDNFLRDGDNKVIHNLSDSETEEIFYVEILSIDRINLVNETTDEVYFEGNFEVVEKRFEILVDIQRWKNRKDEVGITQAKQELKQWLVAQKSRIEDREKRKIINMQTKTDNLDDFDLEEMDI